MSVRKLSDSRWRVDVEPVRGKRYRKTFTTKAEAVRYESYVRSQHAKAVNWNSAQEDRRRLSDLVELWHSLHGHGLRDSVRRLSKLKALSDRLGNPVAARLESQRYAADRRLRLASGISAKTLNNELGYLRAVYNELYALNQVDYRNPLELVKPLSLQERELSWLTLDQIVELLASIRSGCKNPHVELIVLVCLATGARWSEAENLAPESLRNGMVTFKNTKNGKVRSVPVPDDLVMRLRQHWAEYGLFTGSITSFRRALARTTITLPKGQASHVLRHTFASHFIQQGGNILTLQKILGHSSLAMTMRYSHLSHDHLVDAKSLSPFSTLLRHSKFGQ